jgi:hypothetical protein
MCEIDTGEVCFSVPEAPKGQTGKRPKSPTVVASPAEDESAVCNMRGGGSCGLREDPACAGPGVSLLAIAVGAEDTICGSGIWSGIWSGDASPVGVVGISTICA